MNISPDDTRLVINKRDSYSAFLTGVHELGHAIDGHLGSYEYPELYRFYSSIAAEGIAELFQTIPTDPTFLKKSFTVSEETLSHIQELEQLTSLNMVKINYYYSLVEYELYKDPDEDFHEIASKCYKQVFGYNGEVFHPASELFYIELPVFFQDYNYALATREMIRHKYKLNSLYNQEDVFNEIEEKYIKPCQLLTWSERVKQLCGEEHTFKYLAKRVNKTIESST
ncbi:hypothetical protein LC087_08705 [Bacillus carboniphilus]|uniref:Peptidase M3A/M3B catalytic domain-containing protein n=1 Tax=Bacillus carboniphilus TaxID=86663 RepID=A0ABY9K0D5_9BACI|nr:hypothetical protein [Bacillus carboniphilus]WLR44145.1 hypothetical protein LC087_08705 [Bacillus carboniphilus]